MEMDNVHSLDYVDGSTVTEAIVSALCPAELLIEPHIIQSSTEEPSSDDVETYTTLHTSVPFTEGTIEESFPSQIDKSIETTFSEEAVETEAIEALLPPNPDDPPDRERQKLEARIIKTEQRQKWNETLESKGFVVCTVPGCHMRYSTIISFERHYKWCTGDKGMGVENCPYCENQFLATDDGIMTHILEGHPDDVEDYQVKRGERLAAAITRLVVNEENKRLAAKAQREKLIAEGQLVPELGDDVDEYGHKKSRRKGITPKKSTTLDGTNNYTIIKERVLKKVKAPPKKRKLPEEGDANASRSNFKPVISTSRNWSAPRKTYSRNPFSPSSQNRDDKNTLTDAETIETESEVENYFNTEDDSEPAGRNTLQLRTAENNNTTIGVSFLPDSVLKDMGFQTSLTDDEESEMAAEEAALSRDQINGEHSNLGSETILLQENVQSEEVVSMMESSPTQTKRTVSYINSESNQTRTVLAAGNQATLQECKSPEDPEKKNRRVIFVVQSKPGSSPAQLPSGNKVAVLKAVLKDGSVLTGKDNLGQPIRAVFKRTRDSEASEMRCDTGLDSPEIKRTKLVIKPAKASQALPVQVFQAACPPGLSSSSSRRESGETPGDSTTSHASAHDTLSTAPDEAAVNSSTSLSLTTSVALGESALTQSSAIACSSALMSSVFSSSNIPLSPQLQTVTGEQRIFPRSNRGQSTRRDRRMRRGNISRDTTSHQVLQVYNEGRGRGLLGRRGRVRVGRRSRGRHPSKGLSYSYGETSLSGKDQEPQSLLNSGLSNLNLIKRGRGRQKIYQSMIKQPQILSPKAVELPQEEEGEEEDDSRTVDESDLVVTPATRYNLEEVRSAVAAISETAPDLESALSLEEANPNQITRTGTNSESVVLQTENQSEFYSESQTLGVGSELVTFGLDVAAEEIVSSDYPEVPQIPEIPQPEPKKIKKKAKKSQVISKVNVTKKKKKMKKMKPKKLLPKKVKPLKFVKRKHLRICDQIRSKKSIKRKLMIAEKVSKALKLHKTKMVSILKPATNANSTDSSEKPILEQTSPVTVYGECSFDLSKEKEFVNEIIKEASKEFGKEVRTPKQLKNKARVEEEIRLQKENEELSRLAKKAGETEVKKEITMNTENKIIKVNDTNQFIKDSEKVVKDETKVIQSQVSEGITSLECDSIIQKPKNINKKASGDSEEQSSQEPKETKQSKTVSITEKNRRSLRARGDELTTTGNAEDATIAEICKSVKQKIQESPDTRTEKMDSVVEKLRRNLQASGECSKTTQFSPRGVVNAESGKDISESVCNDRVVTKGSKKETLVSSQSKAKLSSGPSEIRKVKSVSTIESADTVKDKLLETTNKVKHNLKKGIDETKVLNKIVHIASESTVLQSKNLAEDAEDMQRRSLRPRADDKSSPQISIEETVLTKAKKIESTRNSGNSISSSDSKTELNTSSPGRNKEKNSKGLSEIENDSTESKSNSNSTPEASTRQGNCNESLKRRILRKQQVRSLDKSEDDEALVVDTGNEPDTSTLSEKEQSAKSKRSAKSNNGDESEVISLKLGDGIKDKSLTGMNQNVKAVSETEVPVSLKRGRGRPPKKRVEQEVMENETPTSTQNDSPGLKTPISVPKVGSSVDINLARNTNPESNATNLAETTPKAKRRGRPPKTSIDNTLETPTSTTSLESASSTIKTDLTTVTTTATTVKVEEEMHDKSQLETVIVLTKLPIPPETISALSSPPTLTTKTATPKDSSPARTSTHIAKFTSKKTFDKNEDSETVTGSILTSPIIKRRGRTPKARIENTPTSPSTATPSLSSVPTETSSPATPSTLPKPSLIASVSSTSVKSKDTSPAKSAEGVLTGQKASSQNVKTDITEADEILSSPPAKRRGRPPKTRIEVTPKSPSSALPKLAAPVSSTIEVTLATPAEGKTSLTTGTARIQSPTLKTSLPPMTSEKVTSTSSSPAKTSAANNPLAWVDEAFGLNEDPDSTLTSPAISNTPVKRGRGRPPKVRTENIPQASSIKSPVYGTVPIQSTTETTVTVPKKKMLPAMDTTSQLTTVTTSPTQTSHALTTTVTSALPSTLVMPSALVTKAVSPSSQLPEVKSLAQTSEDLLARPKASVQNANISITEMSETVTSPPVKRRGRPPKSSIENTLQSPLTTLPQVTVSVSSTNETTQVKTSLITTTATLPSTTSMPSEPVTPTPPAPAKTFAVTNPLAWVDKAFGLNADSDAAVTNPIASPTPVKRGRGRPPKPRIENIPPASSASLSEVSKPSAMVSVTTIIETTAAVPIEESTAVAVIDSPSTTVPKVTVPVSSTNEATPAVPPERKTSSIITAAAQPSATSLTSPPPVMSEAVSSTPSTPAKISAVTNPLAWVDEAFGLNEDSDSTVTKPIVSTPPVKRGRGRPPKPRIVSIPISSSNILTEVGNSVTISVSTAIKATTAAPMEEPTTVAVNTSLKMMPEKSIPKHISHPPVTSSSTIPSTPLMPSVPLSESPAATQTSPSSVNPLAWVEEAFGLNEDSDSNVKNSVVSTTPVKRRGGRPPKEYLQNIPQSPSTSIPGVENSSITIPVLPNIDIEEPATVAVTIPSAELIALTTSIPTQVPCPLVATSTLSVQPMTSTPVAHIPKSSPVKSALAWVDEAFGLNEDPVMPDSSPIVTTTDLPLPTPSFSSTPIKRGRGRPPKKRVEDVSATALLELESSDIAFTTSVVDTMGAAEQTVKAFVPIKPPPTISTAGMYSALLMADMPMLTSTPTTLQVASPSQILVDDVSLDEVSDLNIDPEMPVVIAVPPPPKRRGRPPKVWVDERLQSTLTEMESLSYISYNETPVSLADQPGLLSTGLQEMNPTEYVLSQARMQALHPPRERLPIDLPMNVSAESRRPKKINKLKSALEEYLGCEKQVNSNAAETILEETIDQEDDDQESVYGEEDFSPLRYRQSSLPTRQASRSRRQRGGSRRMGRAFSFRAPRSTRHVKGSFTCCGCNAVFDFYTQAKTHVLAAHNGLANINDDSPIPQDEVYARLKMALKIRKMLICHKNNCGRDFRSLMGYVNHAKECGLAIVYSTCDVCGKQLRASGMQLHRSRHLAQERELQRLMASEDQDSSMNEEDTSRHKLGPRRRKAAIAASSRMQEFVRDDMEDGLDDIKDDGELSDPNDEPYNAVKSDEETSFKHDRHSEGDEDYEDGGKVDDETEERVFLNKLRQLESFFEYPCKTRNLDKETNDAWTTELQEKGNITCTIKDCDKIFTSKMAMLYHWQRCMTTPDWTCLKCEQTTAFKSGYSMYRHLLNSHRLEIPASFWPRNTLTASGRQKYFKDKPTNVGKDYACNPSKTVTSLNVAHHALQFCKNHYVADIFLNWRPRKKNWKKLNDADCFQLPFKESVSFRLEQEGGLRTKAQSLKLFESAVLKEPIEHVTINVGGPVWSSAWCPVPYHRRTMQYVAMGVSLDPDRAHHISDTSAHKGIIQLWRIGHLNRCSMEGLPRLMISVAHRFGVIWDLCWCPSGTWEDPAHDPVNPNLLSRLGLLAIACGDGFARILSFPHPNESYRTDMYAAVPVAELCPPDEGSSVTSWKASCTTVSWQRTDYHTTLLAGYGNGCICQFDLTSRSPLLVLGVMPTVMRPFMVFSAHSSAVTCLNFAPVAGSRFFASSGLDRTTCIWDLQDTSTPLHMRHKGILRDLAWTCHWCGYFGAQDECYNLVLSHSFYKEFGYYNLSKRPLSSHGACTWGISVSEWLNIEASCDAAGEVVMMGLPESEHSLDGMKGLTNSRMPVYRVELEPIPTEGEEVESQLLQVPAKCLSLDCDPFQLQIPTEVSAVINLSTGTDSDFDLNLTSMEDDVDSFETSPQKDKSECSGASASPGNKRTEQNQSVKVNTTPEDSANQQKASEEDNAQLKELAACKTYADITSKYRLVFKEAPLRSLGKISKEDLKRIALPQTMNHLVPGQYMLTSVNTICWNPNPGSHWWLFSAGQAGLARLSCVGNLTQPVFEKQIETLQTAKRLT